MPLPRATLMGSKGRLPFNGHLRLSVQDGDARLHVAARLAHGAPPPEAWRAVNALYAALSRSRGHDRWAICRDAWERLAALDRGALGPAAGADASLLLVSEDAGGETISGVGLSGLWCVEGEGTRPMVPVGHPLLGEAGLPPAPPRVLVPARPGPAYLARCAGEPGEPPGAIDAEAGRAR